MAKVHYQPNPNINWYGVCGHHGDATTVGDEVTCNLCLNTKVFRDKFGTDKPPKAEGYAPQYVHFVKERLYKPFVRTACGHDMRENDRQFNLAEDPRDVTCPRCKASRAYNEAVLSPDEFALWSRGKGGVIHLRKPGGNRQGCFCHHWCYNDQKLTDNPDEVTCKSCRKKAGFDRAVEVIQKRKAMRQRAQASLFKAGRETLPFVSVAVGKEGPLKTLGLLGGVAHRARLEIVVVNDGPNNFVCLLDSNYNPVAKITTY